MKIVLPFLVFSSAVLTQCRTDMLTRDPNTPLRRSKRFGIQDAVEIVATVVELWDAAEKHFGDSNIQFTNLTVDLGFLNRKQAQLNERILEVSRQIDRLEENMAKNVDYTIDSILSAIPKIVQTGLRFNDLRNVLNQIYIQERQMQRYLENRTAIERHTLEDWALAVTSHQKDSIRNLLSTMESDVTPSSENTLTPSIFDLVQFGDTSRTCEYNQSQQQIIYQLYQMIAVAELKGFVMINYAWMLLRLYEKGNFTAEADLFNTLYQDRTVRKIEAAKTAMAEADRSLFKCDPKQWKEGENYVKLTKLLQGYIENEVNLNPYQTCRENCRYYQVTEYHGCFKNQFCSQQAPCKGKIVQCTYLDSDMNICQSESSDRRYDWIEYENGRILGTKGTCNSRFNHKVDSWWRYLFWHCSYCFCLCDDKSPQSDRYFNLREVKSDIKSNRVVTGVRFVKEKQVIHIQIQQGELLPRGIINKSSLEWLPVSGYNILDDDVQVGIDYHTMTWNERSIDLDDVVAPSDHVVTGCRLRMVGPHLNLEIRATPFDFDTGVVHPDVESAWLANDNTDGALKSPRSEVYIPNADVPTKKGPNTPNSKHDQFIQFKESSMSLDASQTTVPFIDAQPVLSNGFPVSGLGIYHKGTFNSGGFVALKLITFDFSPHLIAEQPNTIPQ